MRILVIVFLLLTFKTGAQNYPDGLHVNDQAPDFTAKDQHGTPVNLKTELKRNPVVLIFYRGQWCPYCIKQLKNLEDSLQLVREKGVSLFAVTPESAENVGKTIEKTKSSFPILSDDSLKIMKSYKVAFELDPKTTGRYKGFGVDLLLDNGNNGNNLPVPAVYIIDKEGKITFRYFDTNYKKRLSVKELLSQL